MSDPAGAIPSLLAALRALPLWLFIGLAAASYAILFIPPFAGVDPTNLRETWGAWIWAWAVAFTTLSLVGIADWIVAIASLRRRTRASRRILRLVPLDHQRWWHLAKQQDGSFASQISFQCQVSNTTDRPVQIVRGRLIRPRLKANVLVSLPVKGSQYHSFKYPLPPNDTVAASVNIFATGVLGAQGKPIRVTVALIDQFGEEYRLRNLVIETHDTSAPPMTLPGRACQMWSSFSRTLSGQKERVQAIPASPWTYEPGQQYLTDCEAILAEERRSYAARGRRTGQLGSLNVGLQSEPNLGWTTEGEIPQLLWKKGEGTPLSSPNLDRLIKIRNSLARNDQENLERFLLNQLRTDSPFADVAYFVVLALYRMNRIVDALTAARLCLVEDKVYGYSNVLGMLSALVSHEHDQISDDLYRTISASLAPGAEQEFRLREKLNLAQVQRIDET